MQVPHIPSRKGMVIVPFFHDNQYFVGECELLRWDVRWDACTEGLRRMQMLLEFSGDFQITDTPPPMLNEASILELLRTANKKMKQRDKK